MFLLSEEYQRNNPRTECMGRHLYDLERLMLPPAVVLADMSLSLEIIAHRCRFYHVGGANYNLLATKCVLLTAKRGYCDTLASELKWLALLPVPIVP